MHHPRELVTLWYEDEYNRRWEEITIWSQFKSYAPIFLEKHIAKDVVMYYTVSNETFILDYYNLEMQHD